MKAFFLIVRRDLRLALRQPGDTGMVLVFFVLATILFPFGIGPEPNILARIAAGVLWVMALLAAMLSFDRLFQADYEDGTLELLVLSPVPAGLIVLAKCAAHWLTTGLPLIVVTPLLGVMLHLDASGYGVLLATMALGTPTISLIGAVGAGVDTRRTARRRADVAAGSADPGAGADLRGRGGRGHDRGVRRARASAAARRAGARRPCALPMGRLGGIAPGAGMIYRATTNPA